MRGWFVRLMVIAWVAQFISSAVRPLITYRTLAEGAGPMAVGIVAAAFSVLALLAAIPLGILVDRKGESAFLLLGAGLVVSALGSLLLPGTLVGLATSSAVLGLGHLSLVAASQTMIARGSSADLRENRFAALTSVNATGQILGPAVTGLLVGNATAAAEVGDAVQVRGMFVVAIALLLALVAAAFAGSLIRWPGKLSQRPVPTASVDRGRVGAVLRIPEVPTAMLASLTVLTCVDLLGVYLPVLGHEEGISPKAVGGMLALQGVAAMLVRIWMVPLVARFERRRLLVATMSLAALGLIAVPFCAALEHPLPMLAVAMVACGLGLGIGQPATMAWVATQTPVDLRGTAVSIRLTGNRAGLILVPICAGALADRLGVATAFWCPALALLGVAALVFRAKRVS